MSAMSYRLAAVSGLLLALSVMIVPTPCHAHEVGSPDSIKFGVFPYKSPKTIIEIYGPLAAYLEKKLGRKIRISSATDAKSFLDKAGSGEYDLLLSAPPVYYKLRPAGYRVIARGTPSFYGGAIVRKDSEISTIEQLKGKKVAAVGKYAYAGYLFLLPQLEEKGLDPREEVDFTFLGKVDTIIYGVINKTFDAGLLRLDALDRSVFNGIREDLRVIGRSPEIPQFPFAVKNSMDAATIAAIQEALAALSPDRPEERQILNGMQVNNIIAATDADYDLFYEQIKDSDYLRQP